jgi:RadC-like JAB domain
LTVVFFALMSATKSRARRLETVVMLVPKAKLRGAPTPSSRRDSPSAGSALVITERNTRSGRSPSSDAPQVAEHSQAEEIIRRRFRDALALVDVRVVGRIIVDDGWFYSFAQRGLLSDV